MLSIDRFENDAVICEDENQNKVILSRDEVPKDVKEGDMLAKGDDGEWKIDRSFAQKRRSSLFKKLCKLSDK